MFSPTVATLSYSELSILVEDISGPCLEGWVAEIYADERGVSWDVCMVQLVFYRWAGQSFFKFPFGSSVDLTSNVIFFYIEISL